MTIYKTIRQLTLIRNICKCRSDCFIKMSTGDISSEETNGKGLMKKLNNYIIVDVGANLTNKKFSRDLDAVIQRAKDAGK